MFYYGGYVTNSSWTSAVVVTKVITYSDLF